MKGTDYEKRFNLYEHFGRFVRVNGKHCVGYGGRTESVIRWSYQVADNFYAGEYPFEKSQGEGLPKLQSLLDFGIKHFIDLTEKRQRLTKYNEFLPNDCTYLNLPTYDYTVPSFENLKRIHDFISQSKDKVYVHCKGGFDRTGIAVATWFIYTGLSAMQARDRYWRVADKMRLRYPHLPLIETRWEVLEEYQEWLAKENPK